MCEEQSWVSLGGRDVAPGGQVKPSSSDKSNTLEEAHDQPPTPSAQSKGFMHLILWLQGQGGTDMYILPIGPPELCIPLFTNLSIESCI